MRTSLIVACVADRWPREDRRGSQHRFATAPLTVIPATQFSGMVSPVCIVQIIMKCVGSTHFITFAEAILFRGAGFGPVFRGLLAVAALGALFL